ncbi:MAG: hypothetical protein ACYCZ6_17995, partial [Polaromonas sp.]
FSGTWLDALASTIHASSNSLSRSSRKVCIPTCYNTDSKGIRFVGDSELGKLEFKVELLASAKNKRKGKQYLLQPISEYFLQLFS